MTSFSFEFTFRSNLCDLEDCQQLVSDATESNFSILFFTFRYMNVAISFGIFVPLHENRNRFGMLLARGNDTLVSA